MYAAAYRVVKSRAIYRRCSPTVRTFASGGDGGKGSDDDNANSDSTKKKNPSTAVKQDGKLAVGKLLLKAAAGELKNKDKIPRQLGRKPHASLESADLARRGGRHIRKNQDLDDEVFEDGDGLHIERDADRTLVFDAIKQQKSDSKNAILKDKRGKTITLDEYSDLLEVDKERYYWNEFEYEIDEDFYPLENPGTTTASRTHMKENYQAIMNQAISDALAEEAEKEKQAKSDEEASKAEEGEKSEKAMQRKKKKPLEDIVLTPHEQMVKNAEHDYNEWFNKHNDIIEIAADPNHESPLDKMTTQQQKNWWDEYNKVKPGLENIHGPHRFVSETFEILHPDSRREPKPHFPQRRRRCHPSLEFVKAHSRFLYVTGLPPLDVDGESFDLKNPVHNSLMQTSLSNVTNVPTKRIFPSSATSGFIGYNDPLDYAFAVANGAVVPTLESIPEFSAYRGDNSFAQGKKTVQLTNLPCNSYAGDHTSVSLARDLFPSGSDLGAVYGDIQASDILFLSRTHVLINFSSEDQAQSVLDSHLVLARLRELGSYKVRVFRARRELVHKGWGGIMRKDEERSMGPRLIVDGDMPTRQFYISHAACILVENLDPSLTKKEISALVQPYCARRRDVEESIEYVKCEAGIRTNRAYIGFDLPGEAEAVFAAFGTWSKVGDRSLLMKLVKDRVIPGQAYAGPERRPDRPVEELWKDLDDWEQHVNPADLKYLEDNGVAHHVLNDTFRNMRRRNRAFGPLDASIREEAIEPNLKAGQKYKEIVQLYIESLKETLATEDDVGFTYKALHYPDEPIDLSPFARERERQVKLKEERESYRLP